ncbi:MAG TPA: hypothetical protein VN783_01115 [Thermoanaerobaculia bacterium]|nr:hypothetical protein [Thermoanaerobaculia bacterium]
MLRDLFVFSLLLLLKVVTRLFYRVRMEWVGTPAPDPWRHIRLVAILNHTSLFEPLYVGGAPNHFLWRLARHGVIPIAKKTSDRKLVGRFFGLIAKHVVPITRARDESWKQVLASIDPDAMVGILPEGRMKRATGLDSEGRPMTVRGGIADLLDSIGEGRLLLAYSGGLHHVQVPGQRFPRLWKTIRMRLELLEIDAYRREMMERGGGTPEGFKAAVIADLERRRDELCPAVEA